ncbi:MAG: hypothetical protein ACRC7N_03415 [Clostridium sp.]
MYTSHGINMKREMEYYDKRIKRVDPNRKSPYMDYKYVYSEEYPKKQYKFSDMVDSVKQGIKSEDNKFTVKSCMLNKDIEVDKKAMTIGAMVVGVGIGLSIAAIATISAMSKPKKKDYFRLDGWPKIIKNIM